MGPSDSTFSPAEVRNCCRSAVLPTSGSPVTTSAPPCPALISSRISPRRFASARWAQLHRMSLIMACASAAGAAVRHHPEPGYPPSAQVAAGPAPRSMVRAVSRSAHFLTLREPGDSGQRFALVSMEGVGMSVVSSSCGACRHGAPERGTDRLRPSHPHMPIVGCDEWWSLVKAGPVSAGCVASRG
jgi:hypothetical protein